MNGVQCDSCRRFLPATQPPSGWWVLVQVNPVPVMHPVMAMLGGGSQPDAEHPPTFCCLDCLIDYAVVRRDAEGPPLGIDQRYK